jgi:cell division protein FtsI/penicillin-binding protein 2
LVAITPTRLAKAALAVLCFWPGGRAQVPESDLHWQSAAATLARDFAGPNLSYLLLNDKGQVIAQRWPMVEKEAPVGSLIKPFLAVAYGQTHESFPTFHCLGKKTCWLPRGHGVIGISQAIAVSCNSYFHQLLAEAEPGFATPTLQSFGLNPQDNFGHDQVDWFEQGHGWRASPLALARAYLQLEGHAREKAWIPVLEGMEFSARTGTASAVSVELHGWPVLAKTGTAPCIHKKHAPGDGLALIMAPADHPRTVLLVRLHGQPGSAAAAVAGKMIAAVEQSGKNGRHP